MDVNEYIASGILESVVLGFASDQEIREVSCLSTIYPEIKTELESIAIAFEKVAFASAVEPEVELKQRIMAEIRETEQIRPVSEEKTAKIVQFTPAPVVSNGNPWKWMSAACIVMLLGAGSLWYSAANDNKELSGQVTALAKSKSQTEGVVTAMKLQQERTEAIQAVLTDDATQNVVMAGLPKDPKAAVKIMWSDKAEKAVMVAQSITPPPSDMQYQLWAIAGGKPVSLGIFDYEEVMAMTEPFEVSATDVSAFAITLEKRGGSPTPTMENMIVMGAVQA